MRSRPFLIAIAAAILSTAARLWLGHRYFGFQTGDDVEIAEEAFRRAIGLTYTPWDVRSLFIPDVIVAPFVRLAHACGITDSLTLLEVARLPFALLAGVNVLLLFLLARRWFDDTTASVASVLYAAHWMPIVYGSSLYPRIFAATCVLTSLIVIEQSRGSAGVFGAGMLAALALTARYSEAIFVVSIVVILFARDDTRRQLTAYIGGFVVGVLLFVGVYDWLTWGHSFGSLIKFAELTFIRRDASSRIVDQPLWWYLTNLPHWLAPTAMVLIAVGYAGARRQITALMFIPVAALSVVYHKELRYLQVVIPFAALFTAYGFVRWWQRPERRRIAEVLLAATLALQLGRVGGVARRTTNAVRAASWIASHHPRGVALSQPWAYGDRVILGNTPHIDDPGVPPRPSQLRELIRGEDCLGVYSSDLNGEIDAIARSERFDERRQFQNAGGRSVTALCRP